MDGLVFDIKRGVTKDGPGLRTSVFLKGCPLRCAWCHNPESQSPDIERSVTTGELCGRRMTVDEVMDEVRRDVVFYKPSGGGLTITGGEPLSQPDFTAALAKAALDEGIPVAIDTSGFAPWSAFEALLDILPGRPGSSALLFLYDLKCMDPERHRSLTGVDNAPILDNLRRLDAAGARLWIRCPLVPGLNDSDADLTALRGFIAGLRRVERTDPLPYHPLGLEKYAAFGKTPRFARREGATAEDIARYSAGLACAQPSTASSSGY